MFLTPGAAPNVESMPASQSAFYPTGRRSLLGLALAVVLVAAAACGSNESTISSAPPTPPTGSARPTTSATPTLDRTAPTSEETRPVTIRVTIGDDTIAGELNDSPTAQDLARQLPLTITLDDFNNVEKVGELPRPLTMDGVPAGADPEINDIGYHRPSNGLVFYYGEVGYFNGIVRLGHLSSADMQLIQRQSGQVTVTLEAS
jgi:hypothetical protein